MKISNVSIKDIGESLKKAGNLKTNPLAVYGLENIPDGAEPICSFDHCVAKVIFEAAINEKIPALYMGKNTLKGCCPGSMTYFGFKKPLKFIRYFVSTGNKNFRGGEAEYLKASPPIVDEFIESIGDITPLGKNIVIERYNEIKEDVDVKSILCFGKGEQIRNLASLIHFRTKNPFNAINMPFGPACATFITYPAGMAEKTPKGTSFVGPVDPTGNIWFPEELMAIAIPIDIAVKMHEDLETSFAIKRPEVAYPQIRDNILY